MRIIEPSYEILTPIDKEILLSIEKIARVCYKSEGKIKEGSAERMMGMLVKNGHGAMIEFSDVIVKFVHNRGFSHEMIRHRHCSFAQESTRYCNYSTDKFSNEITVIKPYWSEYHASHTTNAYDIWEHAMKISEEAYFNLEGLGLVAQDARGVLPTDLKTEIVVKANIREWRHIFVLRTAPPAHPDMQRVMIPLLEEFKKRIPVLFDDIPC